MAKLYELRFDYEKLLNEMPNYIDENGEISQDFTTQLNSITDDIQEKAVSVAIFIKRLEAEQLAYKAEIDRLTAEKRKGAKSIEYYKQYIANAMQTAEIDKIKDVKANISFRKSEKLEIEENAVVPLDYMVVKSEPNKTALKEAIKGGKTFEGITIKECKNIQIK